LNLTTILKRRRGVLELSNIKFYDDKFTASRVVICNPSAAAIRWS